MAVRAGFCVFLILIGWLLPFVIPIIAVFSAVFCVCNMFFFPLYFYYRIRDLANLRRQVRVPLMVKLYRVVVFFVGCCSMVFGLIGALDDLIDKLQGKNPNPMNADKPED